MSDLNGSNVRSLMEAYHSIYEPKEQELTEEQVWEEVEGWVNTLLEAGYDLSEFTWEDMYAAYIEEQGGTNRRGQGSTSGAAQSQALQNLGQSFKSFADRGGVAGAINRALQSASQRNGNPDRRGQGSTSGATVRRPQPAPTNTTRPAPTNTTRPAPTNTTRPAPTNTTRPAPVANSGAAKPATPAPGAVTKPVVPTAAPAPTTPVKPAAVTQPPESKSQASAGEIRGMIGRSMERQAASTTPQLSARAQALKAGGPKLGPRGM